MDGAILKEYWLAVEKNLGPKDVIPIIDARHRSLYVGLRLSSASEGGRWRLFREEGAGLELLPELEIFFYFYCLNRGQETACVIITTRRGTVDDFSQDRTFRTRTYYARTDAKADRLRYSNASGYADAFFCF